MAKPWTVLFYLVAEPIDQSTPAAGAQLSASADAEIDAIGKAAASFSDVMNVVCQVDHNGPGGITRVAFDDTCAHDLSVPAADQALSPGNRDTIRRFFAAASKAYPSERQAVFFWGHSFGPGGMFITKPPAQIASPVALLAQHRKAMVARTKLPMAGAGAGAGAGAAPAGVEPAKRVLSIPDLASILTAATGNVHKHLDLVVFKDCFMNTLEVAYELAPVVDLQLGTQAEIPIFKKSGTQGALDPSVWPYEALFAALANSIAHADPAQTAGIGMLKALDEFYSDSNNRGDREQVPLALLDLRNFDEVTPKLNAFVEAIKIANDPVGAPERSRKILSAAAGDPALVDVVRMCDQFKPSGDSLTDVVCRHVAARSPIDGFNGVSVFYRPGGLEPQGIVMTGLTLDDYQLLRLDRVTEWTEQAAFEAMMQPA